MTWHWILHKNSYSNMKQLHNIHKELIYSIFSIQIARSEIKHPENIQHLITILYLSAVNKLARNFMYPIQIYAYVYTKKAWIRRKIVDYHVNQHSNLLNLIPHMWNEQLYSYKFQLVDNSCRYTTSRIYLIH